LCLPCAAVVVLSPELVHGQRPTQELQILLERKARDPSSIAIIPVFIDLTSEQCDDLAGPQHAQPWPQGIQQSSEQEWAESRKEWAAAIEKLSLQPLLVARSEEVGVLGVSGGACAGLGVMAHGGRWAGGQTDLIMNALDILLRSKTLS
jgi:hypothetical protein